MVLTLLAITFVSAAAVGTIYEITQEPIAAAKSAKIGQCGRAGRAAVRQQSGRDENDRLAGRQDRYGLYGPDRTGHGRICDRDIFQQRIRR